MRLSQCIFILKATGLCKKYKCRRAKQYFSSKCSGEYSSKIQVPPVLKYNTWDGMYMQQIHEKHLISGINVPIFISLSLFPLCHHQLQHQTFSLQYTDTSYLSLLIETVSGIHSSRHTGSQREIMSFLTQSGGVKWSMSLTLPLPSRVARAQTLEQVALNVCFGPRISNAVGQQHILVVTAI